MFSLNSFYSFNKLNIYIVHIHFHKSIVEQMESLSTDKNGVNMLKNHCL